MTFEDFPYSNPQFSSFENNLGPTDGPTDGQTDSYRDDCNIVNYVIERLSNLKKRDIRLSKITRDG